MGTSAFYWIGVATCVLLGIVSSIAFADLAEHCIKAVIFCLRARKLLRYKKGLNFLDRRKADLSMFSYAFDAGEQAGVHSHAGVEVLWPGVRAAGLAREGGRDGG